MNTCDTCRFWTQKGSNFGGDNSFMGQCSCTNFKYTGSMDSQELDWDDFAYWDYEGYDAGFETGPKFGCIHHKVK